MHSFKNIFGAATLLAVGLTAGSVAQAVSIGVNFMDSDAGRDTLAAEDVAGVPGFAQANWNNVFGNTGFFDAAVDSEGNAVSGLEVDWLSANTWRAPHDETASANHRLLKGYVDDGTNDSSGPLGAEIGVANVPYGLYDVVLYISTDTPNLDSGAFFLTDFDNNDITPRVYGGQMGSFNGTFVGIDESSTVLNSGPDGNYVLFSGVTASDIVLKGDREGNTRASIAGFQIIPSTLLSLEVNTATGEATIINSSGVDIDTDLLQIGSESGALNPAGWMSLADQDYDGSGAVNNTGDGWEELGNASDSQIAEAFLQGNTTIAFGDEIDLGKPFALGGDEDVVFTYRTAEGLVRTGFVTYINEPGEDLFPGLSGGDTNLIVDAEDLANLRNNFGADSATSPEGDIVGPDGQFIGGTIGAAQLAALRNNFGTNYNSSAIPEPASLAMLAAGSLLAVRRRRMS